MKLSLKIILVVGFLFAAISLGIRVGAASEAEYVLSADGEEYILEAYSNSSLTPIIRSGKLADIFDILNKDVNSEKRLVFKDVTALENINLDGGSYVITGKISAKGGAVINIHSGSVRIQGAEICLLEGAYIRHKGGNFIFESGSLISEGKALLMDYSSDAHFEMLGGEIKSVNGEYGLEILLGRAVFRGGKIENSGDYAIFSESTLTIIGAPIIKGGLYDVRTSLPITLSDGIESYFGDISVKYETEFEKGNIYPVFYRASESSIAGITLYDKDETKKEVKYFSSHKGTDEKNFAAVSMPYVVNYFHSGALIKSEELFIGMKASDFVPGEILGYTFSGWSTDMVKGELFDFEKPISSDCNLYSKFMLKAPEFVLNSFEETYKNDTYKVGFDKISHPLKDSGTFTYEWYNNGEKIKENDEYVNLKYVSDSGLYKCKLLFAYGNDVSEVVTPEVLFEIRKSEIPVPDIAPKSYTGTYLTPDVYSTYLYTVSECQGLKTGAYPVLFSLIDSENYEFEGGGSKLYRDFVILKANNFFTENPNIPSIYEGETPEPKSSTRFGEVEYLYSSSISGEYTSKIPTESGKYYLIARVRETEDYFALESEPLEFFIKEELLTGLSLFTPPKDISYRAFDVFLPDDLSLIATYNSGREEIVKSDKFVISYQKSTTLRYGDNAVFASYNGLRVLVPITVKKAVYDVSGISFSNSETVYSGKYQTVFFDSVLPMGIDGFPLSAEVIGGGRDAGDYDVTLKFSSESPDYEIPDSITVSLKILPAEVEAFFDDTSFVYDGSLKCPGAYYIDIDGRKKPLSVMGANSFAGEYEAIAVCSDKNYKLISESIVYSIAKATYDFSGVFWSEQTFVYDAEEKTVTVSGLPSGVEIIGYTNHKNTEAGKYTASVSLSYDTLNYNPPESLSHTWEIKKADYDLSGFHFEDSKYTYDGKTHYPVFVGEMPKGLDGIMLEYGFSGGAKNVSDGRVSVSVNFKTESKNYNIPESITVFAEIEPLGIYVNWENPSFVYNTYYHAPKAYSSLSGVEVVGGAKNAGSYVATAISLDANYYIINETFNYTIQKAENFWLAGISVNNVFEGWELSPSAKALAGETEFCYMDKEGNILENVPSAPGEYYVFAYSLGNENYKEINSEKLLFEIIALRAVDIDVLLFKNEFFAFEKIGKSDTAVTVSYNDGSKKSVSYEDLIITYRNADSFRFSDSEVEISYLDFKKTLNVSVLKANYDMSGVYWENTNHIYDGCEKRIVLSGLPAGVSVSEYIGGCGTDSGRYEASALLLYDSENYNPPVIPKGILIIEKAVITLPTLENLTYNGEYQLPKIEGSGLYEISGEKQKNAGEYFVILKLIDSGNYIFESSLESIRLSYKILPKELTVKLSDVNKHYQQQHQSNKQLHLR